MCVFLLVVFLLNSYQLTFTHVDSLITVQLVVTHKVESVCVCELLLFLNLV